MNVAVAGFTIALLFNATGAFAIVTPVLGVSLLVGIVAHTVRLQTAVAPTESARAPSPS